MARVTLGCTIIGDLTRGAIETPRRYDRVSTGLLSLVTCVRPCVCLCVAAYSCTSLRAGDFCRRVTIYNLQYFIATLFNGGHYILEFAMKQVVVVVAVTLRRRESNALGPFTSSVGAPRRSVPGAEARRNICARPPARPT